MIVQEDKGFVLVCDVCGREVEGFVDFDTAFEYQKNNSWRGTPGVNLELVDLYVDICPKCLEREVTRELCRDK